jgi:Icc-related predicted phosphoesterase
MNRILAVSDIELPYIYKAVGGNTFKEMDFVISCGDLPDEYLGYIISMLNKDLYYVRGNHAQNSSGQFTPHSQKHWGGIDLHLRSVQTPGGVILAGIEGSLNYNDGPQQYTQSQMWAMVYRLVPRLFMNYVRANRFLDVFVTHAPPWGINDQPDLPHQGIKAFRWLIEAFRPRLHLHGHVRDYLGQRNPAVTHEGTRVINVTGYQVVDL